jgi:hypothetical protein
MSKEKLFELIRKEKVILWAGAGMSRYAGYPSGEELRSIIFNDLTKEEQVSIGLASSPLDALTEEYCIIRDDGKDRLFKILNDIFLKQPKTTFAHKTLSQIPHIKSIITTNYDTLFEKEFGSDCNVILNQRDLPRTKDKHYNVYKIHGDLSDPNSIIIRKSDYVRFFEKSEQNLYWSNIKSLISTHNIAFVGYNLDDININVIFNQIRAELKDKLNDSFFISPDLPEYKIKDLQKHGIQYINIKGEEFIEELYQNIKDNIFEDQRRGFVSSDVFSKFLINYNLSPLLKGKVNGFNLVGLSGISDRFIGRFEFKAKENDDPIIKSFRDFIEGKSFEDFTLSNSNLEFIKLWIEGLNFGELKEIKFESLPSKEGKFDIYLKNGIELNEIKYKAYLSKNIIKGVFQYKKFKLEIILDLQSGKKLANWNFIPPPVVKRAKDGIEVYEAISGLFNGEGFQIIEGDSQRIINKLDENSGIVKYFKKMALYYTSLHEIETAKGILFRNIKTNEINNELYELVLETAIIVKEKIITKQHGKNETFDLRGAVFFEDNIDVLRIINENNYNIALSEKESTSLIIHGYTILLGYRFIEIIKAEIINSHEALSGKTDLLRVRSKTNSYKISYQDRNDIYDNILKKHET